MTQPYYMLYNENTLEIQALNVDSTQVPAGSALCKITEKDLIDFHSDKKQHHLFLVVVGEDGFAKFKHRYLYAINQRFDERAVIATDIIQDLDYRKIFFDYLNIKYSVTVDTITLTFDVDRLEENYRGTYIDTIDKNKGNCKIFVTEYGNMSALITSFEMDIYQLTRSKTIEIPLVINKRISLWGMKL